MLLLVHLARTRTNTSSSLKTTKSNTHNTHRVPGRDKRYGTAAVIGSYDTIAASRKLQVVTLLGEKKLKNKNKKKDLFCLVEIIAEQDW